MIYTFNNVGNCLYSIAKDYFKMSDKQVYDMIQKEFEIMKTRLKSKGIDYTGLKKALIPNTEVNRHELCLIFDVTLINDLHYGRKIFTKLLPLLGNEGVYSVLAGDYINIFQSKKGSSDLLKEILKEQVIPCNNSEYIENQQYYIIYFNNIHKRICDNITTELKKFPAFYGYAYLDHNSRLKTYLSRILVSVFLKKDKTIIASHPSDYLDSDNIQMNSYPYQENGFKFLSINEESYEPFLHYKIESAFLDDEDQCFSFNALFPKFDSIEKLKVIISDEKYGYISSKEKGHGNVLESIGYSIADRDKFLESICKKISKNYIYNLEHDLEHEVYKFNLCLEFKKLDGTIRKTIASFKYLFLSGEIFLITFY